MSDTPQGLLARATSLFNKCDTAIQTLKDYPTPWNQKFSGPGGYDQRVDALIQNHATEKIVYSVGSSGDFPDLRSALSFLANKKIKRGTRLQLLDGEHEMTGASVRDITADLEIRGNIDNPSACKIVWIPDSNGKSHGLIVSSSHVTVGGFEMIGSRTSNNTTHRHMIVNRSGSIRASFVITHSANTIVHACEGSYIQVKDIDSRDVLHGLSAANNGAINARGFKLVGNGAGYGSWADRSSDVFAIGGDSTNFNVHAFVDGGGFMDTRGTKMTGGNYGAIAQFGGRLFAGNFPGIDTPVIAEVEHGIRANYGAFISASGLVIDSERTGVVAYAASQIIANFAEVTSKRCFDCSYQSYIEALGTSELGGVVGEDGYKYSPATSNDISNANSLIKWN